jgi:hypothetical protein
LQVVGVLPVDGGALDLSGQIWSVGRLCVAAVLLQWELDMASVADAVPK